MAARTNRTVKDELLKKLDVTPQRLYQVVKARKDELPMSTPLAIYTIAHENGIDISKHLPEEMTAEVRGLVSALRNGRQPAPASPRRSRPRTAARKDVKVTIGGIDVGRIPTLKPAHANDAKRMSERVYTPIYIFENSVRDLIEAVLRNKHGDDWWKKTAPRTARENAEKHMRAEKKDPWHGARGRREIDYVFLNDLWAIIRSNWPDFKDLFPSQAWVETLITSDMNVSRRVLAHMNPLAADDIKNIEAAFRKWKRQLEGVEDKLPST